MASEALMLREPNEFSQTLVATCASGEVYQLQNGLAGVRQGLATPMAIGDVAGFVTDGQHTVIKAVDLVFIKGQKVYWDHSANKAVCYPASDRDFYLGTAVEDVAAATLTAVVNLNEQPYYTIDFARDEFVTVVVKTVVGSTTVEVPSLTMQGAVAKMIFGATAEAQKVDAISASSFTLASNWVAEFGFTIVDDGDAAAVDFSLGVANATHATDADAITESVFLHTDGNVTTMLVESDDGTTEVAATTTTLSYTLGTAVNFVLDGRNPTNVKAYINGAEVNAATTNFGDITLATGPLKLLAHLEKTSDDTTADFRINYMRVRTMQQD